MIGAFASAPCFMPHDSVSTLAFLLWINSLQKLWLFPRGFWKLSSAEPRWLCFPSKRISLTLWKGNRIYTLFLLKLFPSASDTTVFSFFFFLTFMFWWEFHCFVSSVSFCCVAWISDMYTQSPSLWRPSSPSSPSQSPVQSSPLRHCATSCSFTRGRVHTSDLITPGLSRPSPNHGRPQISSQTASLFLALQAGSSVPSFRIPYMCITIWHFLIVDLSFPMSFRDSSFFSQP